MARPRRFNALTNTVLPVGPDPGMVNVSLITFYNPAAAASWLQMFDAAMPNDVTLGTTLPTLSIPLPTTGAQAIPFPQGCQFLNGLQIAATTTATGSSAPATAVEVNLVV